MSESGKIGGVFMFTSGVCIANFGLEVPSAIARGGDSVVCACALLLLAAMTLIGGMVFLHFRD